MYEREGTSVAEPLAKPQTHRKGFFNKYESISVYVSVVVGLVTSV